MRGEPKQGENEEKLYETLERRTIYYRYAEGSGKFYATKKRNDC